jgi:hypothetical protein
MQLPVENQQPNRLIVIIPDCLAGNQELAYKIFWMANREHREVYYLTLVDQEENLLAANLAMITMKAVTASNSLAVQFQLAKTALWKKTLREIYQPGDCIVCQQEQLIKNGLFTTKPLAEYLRDIYKMTTINISGYYDPHTVQVRHLRHRVIAWSGFLLIFVGFFALEILLHDQIQGILKKVILSMLFTIVVGAILIWNSIVG